MLSLDLLFKNCNSANLLLVHSGSVMEAEVATTDHHETAAGACATGGKDLYRQVSRIFVHFFHLCFQLHIQVFVDQVLRVKWQ